MKATGTNTAAMSSVMAMMAPLISPITFFTASYGVRCGSSSIFACTASTTTIASSTTMPMASTSAKRVMRLMVRSKACMKMKAPMSDTGTASVGMSVERQSPRKRNTTSATSTKASTSVCATLSIDALRKLETS